MSTTELITKGEQATIHAIKGRYPSPKKPAIGIVIPVIKPKKLIRLKMPSLRFLYSSMEEVKPICLTLVKNKFTCLTIKNMVLLVSDLK